MHDLAVGFFFVTLRMALPAGVNWTIRPARHA